MHVRILSALLLLALLVATRPAAAQSPDVSEDRPFIFSVSTPRTDTRHATVHLETGFGERAFDVDQGDRLEQRLGVQASLGRGLTLLARVGVANGSEAYSTSQQGELLYSLVQAPAHHGSLAVGMGIRHESAGVNVLLGRVAAGRTFSVWRVDGNALFEKPFSAGRDAVDLITTVGVARRVSSAVHVGVEMIGEDLEGFWEADEAEGGARLLLGPSIRLAPPATRWQLSIAGGPIVHATRSPGTTDAARTLPSSGRDGFAVRASFAYAF
jgi:hypothetical protein